MGVPSAVVIRTANAVVALAVVLGSRTVETLATPNLIIHGPRASKLVKSFQFRSNHRQKSYNVTWKLLTPDKTLLNHGILLSCKDIALPLVRVLVQVPQTANTVTNLLK